MKTLDEKIEELIPQMQLQQANNSSCFIAYLGKITLIFQPNESAVEAHCNGGNRIKLEVNDALQLYKKVEECYKKQQEEEERRDKNNILSEIDLLLDSAKT